MTFEELEDLFLSLEINLNPSTFHGLLCGKLCWNDEKIDSFMTESADIFSISSDKGMDADQALRELYDETGGILPPGKVIEGECEEK